MRMNYLEYEEYEKTEKKIYTREEASKIIAPNIDDDIFMATGKYKENLISMRNNILEAAIDRFLEINNGDSSIICYEEDI